MDDISKLVAPIDDDALREEITRTLERKGDVSKLREKVTCPHCGSEQNSRLRLWIPGGWGAYRCSNCHEDYKVKLFHLCVPMKD